MQFCQLGLHLIVTQAQRRTAAPVYAVKFVFLRAINDCEKVAADSVGNRFHQPKGRIRGDRRIHGAAAAFQNLDADLRRSRHAGANHSMPRQNFRSRSEIFSCNAIDLRVEPKTNN